MQISNVIQSYDGNSRTAKFSEADKCPVCNRGIRPVFVSGYFEDSNIFTIFNYCTMCNNTFLSKYQYSYDVKFGYRGAFLESLPKQFEARIFDAKIMKLSPKFSIVYNQAKNAEDYKLDEIAGMGYRKSLEILIKDYAIFLKPEDKTNIIDPKFTLAQCITTYITDVQLKDLSKLTSWLGNDETHYTRVHLNQDINDLKEYLDAAILYITYDLTVKKASAIVNP